MRLYLILMLILVIFFFAQGCLSFRMSDKKALKEFKKAGVAASAITTLAGNHKMHYLKTGEDSRATIVFVHGSPGGWIEYKKFLRDVELGKKFRLIAIDRPGFGWSEYGNVLPLQQQANVVGKLLQQFRNKQPLYLVGHSLGGPLVALLAADYPAIMNGIVILAGSVDPALEAKESWRPYLDKFPIRDLIPGSMKQSNRELWYLKTDLVQLTQKLPLIQCAVYVLHGNKDILVSVKNTDFIQKTFVNASPLKITIIPGAGHLLPMQRMPEIKKLLLSLPASE